MSVRVADRVSIRSSATEEDLEEARQRLLEHTEEHEINDRMLREYTPSPLTINPPNGHTVLPGPMPTRSLGNYGSVVTISSQSARKKKPRVKRYRLPFLILLAFDWGLIILFSIVVMKKIGFNDYFYVNIHETYFDLVIICTFRVVLNILIYLVLGWVNRVVMAVTTMASVCYIPIKAYYAWNSISGGGDSTVSFRSIATLMMLLITFGMPWITAFFFEFKYLPAELSCLDITSWWDWRAWLWPRALTKTAEDEAPSLPDVNDNQPPSNLYRPRAGFSASTVSLDFRTPIGSSRASPVIVERHGEEELPPIQEDQENSSLEQHSPECDQLSAEDLRFKREGLSAYEAFKEMTSSSDGWTVATTSSEVTIYMKVIERRKVWKLEGILPLPAHHVFSLLYPGDNTPEWNPQCALNQTVHRVDDTTDLVYTVSNSMGPVSSRDFLSVRHKEVDGDYYYSTSKAIASAMKPEQPGKVRAENGPCGYLVVAVNRSQSKFIWILNSNLKGWLPQSVIDQTLTSVLTSSFEKLQVYVQHHSLSSHAHH